MKATILLITWFMSQATIAARTCKAYVPDEWPDSRYTIETISGDNVVTDSITGLMWKQCSEGLSGVDCATDMATTHTWQQALALAKTQNTSGFAGFKDWRVPNQKELRTLVARNCFRPSINENVFPNTPKNWFWSSSPIAGFDTDAWVVNFGVGNDWFDHRSDVSRSRVRLVRSSGK